MNKQGLSVAERLRALADGKKIRQLNWEPGEYLYLEGELPKLGSCGWSTVHTTRLLLEPDVAWEHYEEPQALECWVVWVKGIDGKPLGLTGAETTNHQTNLHY